MAKAAELVGRERLAQLNERPAPPLFSAAAAAAQALKCDNVTDASDGALSAAGRAGTLVTALHELRVECEGLAKIEYLVWQGAALQSQKSALKKEAAALGRELATLQEDSLSQHILDADPHLKTQRLQQQEIAADLLGIQTHVDSLKTTSNSLRAKCADLEASLLESSEALCRVVKANADSSTITPHPTANLPTLLAQARAAAAAYKGLCSTLGWRVARVCGTNVLLQFVGSRLSRSGMVGITTPPSSPPVFLHPRTTAELLLSLDSTQTPTTSVSEEEEWGRGGLGAWYKETCNEMVCKLAPTDALSKPSLLQALASALSAITTLADEVGALRKSFTARFGEGDGEAHLLTVDVAGVGVKASGAAGNAISKNARSRFRLTFDLGHSSPFLHILTHPRSLPVTAPKPPTLTWISGDMGKAEEVSKILAAVAGDWVKEQLRLAALGGGGKTMGELVTAFVRAAETKVV